MANTLDEVAIWFEQHAEAWLTVDPDVFVEACLELEVWEPWTGSDAINALTDYFEEDTMAAAMRFLDVAAALEDDTLAEFTYSDDGGNLVIPFEIFRAAATAPYDESEEFLDRRAWRVAIMALMAESEEE